MRTVGSYLKETREAKGITLDEAAGVTRIGKNYLLAIEGETFDKLPNPAYIKGFLRVYAAFLGLSGDAVIAMYEESRAAQEPRPPRDGSPEEPLPSKAKLPPGRWLIPLLLLAMVVATAIFIGEKGNRSAKGPPALPSPPHAASLPAPVLAVHSSASREPSPVVTATESRASTAATAEGGARTGLILRLKVNQDSWLNITIDNAVSQQYDLKAGDLIEWKGEKSFTLDIGNAGGIEGEFNGKPLKPFGAAGESAHVVLTGEGS